MDGVNIKDIPYNQRAEDCTIPQAKASAFAYSTQVEMVILEEVHLGTFRQPQRTGKKQRPVWKVIGIGYLKGKLMQPHQRRTCRWCLRRGAGCKSIHSGVDEPEPNLTGSGTSYCAGGQLGTPVQEKAYLLGCEHPLSGTRLSISPESPWLLTAQGDHPVRTNR